LSQYADDDFLALAKKVKPTRFKTFKTEVLSDVADFIWVDDQPTAYELQVLEKESLLDRWYQVNTRQDINGLLMLMNDLKHCIPEEKNSAF